MAKSGFTHKNAPAIFDNKSEGGWALCVGAGISLPVFPSWHTLICQLISLEKPGSDAKGLADNLLKQFSPDAIIQATQDRLGKTDKEFADILTNVLYSDIQQKLSTKEFDLFTQGLSSHSGGMTRAQWIEFLSIFRIHYKNMNALSIAEVINEVRDSCKRPSSIISFNAEPSFPALINALYREGLQNVTPPSNKQASGKKILDLVTHSITSRNPTRIPVFFCHGLLPVPTSKVRHAQSVDKLVFSESEYLQLSNNSFSWQSSVFIDVCVSNPVVFLGVSLTDSDMRKWLSWIHYNRVVEIQKFNDRKGPSTNHYWIQKRPSDEAEIPWIESAVAHLGIRLVWIDEWGQASAALRRLIGI